MRFITYFFLGLFLISCSNASETDEKTSKKPEKISGNTHLNPPLLKKEALYDKILGMLVGSAIGDAMGAPTEMWSRENIKINYGFVDQLDTMVRAPSAEGTWEYNLPAGGTTDDTRWKKLIMEFLIESENGFLDNSRALDDQQFAEFILSKYQKDIQSLKNTDGFSPEPFEVNARKMAWLQEWAMVAKPFAEKDLNGYAFALNKFYGGEMTCAGMLYAPALGAFYPSQPELAYSETYKLCLFDIGYARDISALTGAMVAEALRENPSKPAILNVVRDIDPQHYFKSRLVGRSAFRNYQIAKSIVYEANQLDKSQVDISRLIFPKNKPFDTLHVARMQKAFELLDGNNQDMPFHAAEIFLVNLTAIMFCDFDFESSLAFVINYGRDNDTTAAVTGAILGAFHGANNLPPKMVDQVLTVNKEQLGIDLEQLANDFTEKILTQQESS
ncbi:ADP-ribosylglycohydrolase family protein [Flexithrix dorotheae]|uniref:ADP-ribosylglycohydrolase family protein n=1 Tax=Flexithrix dorotheae TaxID=70993 RepID=UPI0003619921|nr:ADP-ribosylglycohydrolase family protein [Flexithrix dorotheae]